MVKNNDAEKNNPCLKVSKECVKVRRNFAFHLNICFSYLPAPLRIVRNKR